MSPRPGTLRGWVVANASLFRYLLVGCLTTAVDIGLFTLLTVAFGWPPLLANLCSTSFTMCLSYVINRRFVFRSDRGIARTAVGFVAVTLGSAFLVQSAVIWAVIALGTLAAPGLSHDVLAPAAKVCATAVGMISNYLGYRWLFRAAPAKTGDGGTEKLGER